MGNLRRLRTTLNFANTFLILSLLRSMKPWPRLWSGSWRIMILLVLLENNLINNFHELLDYPLKQTFSSHIHSHVIVANQLLSSYICRRLNIFLIPRNNNSYIITYDAQHPRLKPSVRRARWRTSLCRGAKTKQNILKSSVILDGRAIAGRVLPVLEEGQDN